MVRLCICLAFLQLLAGAAWSQDSDKAFAPKFYAFQNGVNFGKHEQCAATLRELGYDGVNQVFGSGAKLAEQVAAYDKAGSKVLSVYLNV
ncbi:MAG: hypothetical protein N2C14_31750, partial [Planctomycetales bacterium]